MNSGSTASAPIPIAGGRASITPANLQWLLVGLGLASAMQFYTFDSVNLVLPDMAGAFGASRDEAGWILITYSAALLLGTPLSSYLARRIGLRPYLIGSVLVFLAASLCASLSTRLEQMLVFRAVEGFAGGALNFWWRGSVYTFLTGPARSASMTRVSVMLKVATAIGLLASGLLTDNLSWRFIWVIDAAFAAGALTLLLRHYPREALEPDRQSVPIDPWGVALFAVMLIAAEVVLSRGEIDDWFGSPILTVLSWTALVALVLFVFRACDPDNPNPILRLELIRDRNVLASIVIGILVGMILSGSIYALPEFLRGVDPQRRSATQTGLILCVYAITGASLRPMVAVAVGRFGQRRVTVFALLCLIASMLTMAWILTSNTPSIYFVLPLILYGGSVAPLLSAVGSGTAARVPGAGQMDAVTIYMTFRQFGTALGVALVNIVLDRRQSLHSSRLFENLRTGTADLTEWLGSASFARMTHAGQTAPDAGHSALAALQHGSAQQAEVLAFADAFRVMALVGLVALAFTPLMSPPAKKK
ncbi:MAG TPA: MFS transporter [Caulobacteraceae bacterium]|jgi:EmrB/QacA subfamily drug resistance transporter